MKISRADEFAAWGCETAQGHGPKSSNSLGAGRLLALNRELWRTFSLVEADHGATNRTLRKARRYTPKPSHVYARHQVDSKLTSLFCEMRAFEKFSFPPGNHQDQVDQGW